MRKASEPLRHNAARGRNRLKLAELTALTYIAGL
jgi:hypothetical protein